MKRVQQRASGPGFGLPRLADISHNSEELLTDLEKVRKQLEASADKSVGAIPEDLSGTSSGAVSIKSTRRPKK